MNAPADMTASRPNILLIFADELRADGLSCFGNPVCETPNLDRLAAAGTRFEQCMVTQPTCTPCRASVLTGCYPSALRSRMVGCVTPPDERFLPRVLRGAGYHTASIGKIHLRPQGQEPEAVAAAQGADGTCDYYGFGEVDLVNGHGDQCFGNRYSEWLQREVPDLDARRRRRQTYEPGVPLSYSWELPAHVHSSHYIADRAVDFLQRRAGEEEPFFLHLSFPDPHHPFTVPEPYASRYVPDALCPPLPPVSEEAGAVPPQLAAYRGEGHRGDGECRTDYVIGTPPWDYREVAVADWQVAKGLYYGMIALLDDSIGRVLAALEANGLAENTVVAFLSDHGDYLGDYGLVGKGFHYDCVIRTPLILAGPGVPAGQSTRCLATVLDLAPTVLDLAGVPEPEGVQGGSMVPLLQGRQTAGREAVLTENDDDRAGLRMRTLTTAQWKLTYYLGEEYGELYDREADPDEQHNRWADPACRTVRDALQKRLLDAVLAGIDVANGRIQPPPPPVRKWGHLPV